MNLNPDIKYSGLIIYSLAFIGVLFWPLVLIFLFIYSQFMSKDSEGFSFSETIEHGQKEIEEQWASPPYCSQNISYQPTDGATSTKGAEFIFSAGDVEHYFKNVDLDLEEISRLNQDPVIYKWVQNRNSNDIKPTQVPDNLDQFQYVALSLINSSKGFVSCTLCEHEYKCADLKIIEDDLKPGWNGVQISCPKGHLLFYPQTTHILM